MQSSYRPLPPAPGKLPASRLYPVLLREEEEQWLFYRVSFARWSTAVMATCHWYTGRRIEYKVIARLTGAPLGSVKSGIHRTRKMLLAYRAMRSSLQTADTEHQTLPSEKELEDEKL